LRPSQVGSDTFSAAVAELRNRYFSSLTVEKEYVPWHPPAVPERTALPDPLYFGGVLWEMDRRLASGGLTFYLTQDLERLPTYGMDVVAIVVGDEFTRVPGYFDRVRAIFKNHAVRPALTSNVVREPSLMNFLWLVAHLRACAHHLPGARRYRVHRRRGGRTAPIWRVPVGVGSQVELPVKPLAERSIDLFFAGSVVHRPGAVSGFRERLAPKTIARETMLAEAGALAAKRPDLKVEMVVTREFVDSLVADPVTYSEKLMDSRVALVPRGTAQDTYRFWQALRCGCVAVVDTVPRDPIFHDGAPVVRLRRWEQLEDVVVALLDDEARMNELHRRSLDWWGTKGSPQAVGAFMAERLNGLG
jgi:hypothetical protein